jgi:hypothetical protein
VAATAPDEVVAIDLNPVIVRAAGRGCLVVDAKLELGAEVAAEGGAGG